MTFPLPIADLFTHGFVESLTGLELQFVAVTLRHGHDSRMPEVVSIIALKSYMPVGALKWGLCDGEITEVWVRKSWRRRKVGTVMMEVAKALAEENEWEAPRHSSIRTEDGEAWALALGAEPAEVIEARDEYSSDNPDAEAELRVALDQLTRAKPVKVAHDAPAP